MTHSERSGGEPATVDHASPIHDGAAVPPRPYCSLPNVEPRNVPVTANPLRASLLRLLGRCWVNGTVLHYYFFDQPTDGQHVRLPDGRSEWRKWTTEGPEEDVVRRAFELWDKVGIGLRFVEVPSRDQAEIRIGFMRGDGAWSYIGRDVLEQGVDERTMNFGWDLRAPRESDTAVHEIGHTLGFPHEHQNPHAGIVWDDDAVYRYFASPPNGWERDKTFHNVLRKLTPDTVRGSTWDPDSIMHYSFPAGLIREPASYREGLNPAGGISVHDRTWVRTFYPPLQPETSTVLKPFESVTLDFAPGEQRDFVFRPSVTRYYDIRTFGEADTVMVLFEDDRGEPRYLTADDDGGEERNSWIRAKLVEGRTYIVRIRLYYAGRKGSVAAMLW